MRMTVGGCWVLVERRETELGVKREKGGRGQVSEERFR